MKHLWKALDYVKASISHRDICIGSLSYKSWKTTSNFCFKNRTHMSDFDDHASREDISSFWHDFGVTILISYTLASTYVRISYLVKSVKNESLLIFLWKKAAEYWNLLGALIGFCIVFFLTTNVSKKGIQILALLQRFLQLFSFVFWYFVLLGLVSTFYVIV